MDALSARNDLLAADEHVEGVAQLRVVRARHRVERPHLSDNESWGQQQSTMACCLQRRDQWLATTEQSTGQNCQSLKASIGDADVSEPNAQSTQVCGPLDLQEQTNRVAHCKRVAGAG